MDFSGLSRWFRGLPIVRFFSLPRWAKSAFDLLLTALFILSDGLGLYRGSVWASIINKVIVGFFVGLLLLAGFFFLLSAVCWTYTFIARQLGKTEQPLPPAPSILKPSAHGMMASIPNTLFFVWGVAYLADHSSYALNRIVLAVWAFYAAAGFCLAIGCSVDKWRQSRKRGNVDRFAARARAWSAKEK